ncbi:MAG: rhomboid family intramembrane serine protease [Pontiellaceae bacterium]|jgi:membrane associated rhomboid family serine protease|nr:rhomboid family intramembrane serine protease [Pontiellaceae bacterium]
MTFGVQFLLLANITAYVIEHILGFPLSFFGALYPDWWASLSVWQLISYQFLHQNFMHLFSNMLGLFFLGPETERTLGTNRFLLLYFFSGILGGIGWALLSLENNIPCIGASGSVFGVLGAYAALYPNARLYIYGLFPIKAWALVLALGTYEFVSTVRHGSGSQIANGAHLCGVIVGYIYAAIIGRPDLLQKAKNRFARKKRRPVSRAEIDRILDKAAQHGIHSLTRAERELLKRAGGSG